MSWFLPNGLIKFETSDKEERENSILETVIYAVLYKEGKIGQCIEYLDKYNSVPGSVMRSHDNVTAIACYFKYIGRDDLLRKIKIFPKHIHPRDIIFLSYLKGNILSYPFLILLIPIFYFMALRKWDVAPKLKERLNFHKDQKGWTLKKRLIHIRYFPKKMELSQKRYPAWFQWWNCVNVFGKKYVIFRHFKRSTERLFMLRVMNKNLIFMRFCRKLIEPILIKKYKNFGKENDIPFNDDWFYNANYIYYKDKNHLNIKVSDL